MGSIFLFLSFYLLCTGSEKQAFLNPPEYIGPVSGEYAVTNRAFQGIPSLATAPGGRLWATWYAGKTPGEGKNNYAVLSTSADDGLTWTEVLVVDPDGEGSVRAFDPELWMAPDGNLYWFWTQAVSHDGTIAGVWSLCIKNPKEAFPRFDSPVRWADGVMMCKPLALSSGEWVLPASTWKKTDNSARMVVSADEGKTWAVRGGCNVPEDVRAYDEHIIVERDDGSLWLLARTSYGIGESESSDHGVTWPELTPSNIPHPGSRFFIHRLSSGNLLLVKHGPMDRKTGRSHLTAFVSTDDGITWNGGLLLDERSGISYPDGQQAEDGRIYIVYDYNRSAERQILMATFCEEDAVAGAPVSGAVRLRQMVSDASGGFEIMSEETAATELFRKGASFHKFAMKGAAAKPFDVGELLFTNRDYSLNECPETLEGARFFCAPIGGTHKVSCMKSGTAYVLTPHPGRNNDSQTQRLLEQGFKKVEHPEVLLFNPSSGNNLCALYQKVCVAGEVFEFGKWGIVLFFP